MAEDKKIRVSADLSQMRSLRDETVNLYRDINRFAEEQNKLTDRAISQLKEQLGLLRDRNDLEQLFAELKGKSNKISFPKNETSEPKENTQKEEVRDDSPNREKEITRETIHEITTTTENDVRETTNKNRPSTEGSIESRVEVDKATSPRSYNRREFSDDSDSENQRELSDAFRQETKTLSSTMVTAFDAQNLILRALLQKADLFSRSFNSIIDIISSIDETLYNKETNVPRVTQPTITPPPNDRDNRRSNDPDIRQPESGGERKSGWDRVGNIGTRVISGVGAAVGASPVSMAGSLISGAGGIAGEALGMIPYVGGLLGGMTTAAANVYASIFTASIEKAFEAQRKAVSYSQTMGVSNGQAMGVASREGSYAASALGMNVGEYIQRRAELIRSAGGKEEIIAPVRETQSLMAAERLYGLSPQATNQLQRTMRFSSEETGTRSSSSIIKIFEQTMKQLQLPFSEIASTMEESLTSFNKSADAALEKAGDFDASKIAAVLAGVRAYTGAEGRQLERYQQAFSGQTMSEDDVTQALLIRSVQRMFPELKDLPEVMAKIEEARTGQSPELIQNLIGVVKELSGSQTQFLTNLHNLFPALSWQDLEDLRKDGKLENIGDLSKQMGAILSKSYNNKEDRFAPDAAKQTVSSGESLMSAYENKMIGYGTSNEKTLNSILNITMSIEKWLKGESADETNARKDLGDYVKRHPITDNFDYRNPNPDTFVQPSDATSPSTYNKNKNDLLINEQLRVLRSIDSSLKRIAVE